MSATAKNDARLSLRLPSHLKRTIEQACVLYGAAEFSRDTDVAVLAEAENLNRLQRALDELEAERIAVPPFAAEYLARGHATRIS
jgi:hypothetical protein